MLLLYIVLLNKLSSVAMKRALNLASFSLLRIGRKQHLKTTRRDLNDTAKENPGSPCGDPGGVCSIPRLRPMVKARNSGINSGSFPHMVWVLGTILNSEFDSRLARASPSGQPGNGPSYNQLLCVVSCHQWRPSDYN